MNLVTNWFRQTFSDPQIVFLALALFSFFLVVIFLGDFLMPVLASAVIAYLLEGLVSLLERKGVNRMFAVITVFIFFMLFVSVVIFGLIPSLSRQISQLVTDLPRYIAQGQMALMQLPDQYPEFISVEYVQEISRVIRQEMTQFGQSMVSASLSSVIGVITIMIYLVLMPLLVFFFLKDKSLICAWVTSFLPDNRAFAKAVWDDMDRQVANYVRGKFWEIIIVWAFTYLAFSLFGLQYAMLLAVLVGLSVIIPYIGAAVVTIPVMLIAWFQWGWGPDFLWLMVAYTVIQALDGNVLVPMLFSEVVNLHPVAIVVAILVFGGFWGFWGVFFAIPLATLVQAVITSWPRKTNSSLQTQAAE